MFVCQTPAKTTAHVVVLEQDLFANVKMAFKEKRVQVIKPEGFALVLESQKLLFLICPEDCICSETRES